MITIVYTVFYLRVVYKRTFITKKNNICNVEVIKQAHQCYF